MRPLIVSPSWSTLSVVPGLSGDGGGVVTPVIPSGGSPDYSLNFDGYASTAALIADTATFNGFNDESTDLMDLVVSPVVLPGRTKSMRYHYNHGIGGASTTITISRDIWMIPPFNNDFTSSVQEMWQSFKILYSTNFFGFDGVGVGPVVCDHKLAFGLIISGDGEGGRWGSYIGSGGSPGPYDVNVERPFTATGTGLGGNPPNFGSPPAPRAATVWASNVWWEWRWHLKHSTTATSADGQFDVWLGPVGGSIPKIHHEDSFNTASVGVASRVRGLSLGRNKDGGPNDGRDMYLHWGEVNAWWTKNPGWV